MFDYKWIHPDFRDLVAYNRLDDLDSVMARRDGQRMAPSHRSRDTLRLVLATSESVPATFYLKRDMASRWKDMARNMLIGRGFWTHARTEFEVLTKLAAAGIRCPRVIACVQQGGLRPRGCLLLESLPPSQPLGTFLSTRLKDASTAERDKFFTLLGSEVARLHACGVNQPRLYANHIHVAGEGDDWQIWFLSFGLSVAYHRLTTRQRTYDLATLMATLPRRLADDRDREAFFDTYLSDSHLEHRGTQIISEVARQVERLLTLRKIWEIRESDTDEHRAVRPLESLETGQMWIDRVFRSALKDAGIASFESMMTTTKGHLLRALPDRENWRLDLDAKNTGVQGAYLKKHHVRTAGSWLRAKLGSCPGKSAGRVEARNVARLARGGIAAMRLIAYGEKLHNDGLLESFVLTEELVGYTQLDHFLRQRFPIRRLDRPTPRDHRLDQLIREVAAVASKFHKLGYNHRDLYCCHFFIKEPQPSQFKVNLIDLQRVEHRRHFRWRWLVKDLAQLAYSAPRERISLTQRMAFVKYYLGVKKLSPEHKRLIRQVLAKQRLMERHLGMAA